jgi:hypothetical protein
VSEGEELASLTPPSVLINDSNLFDQERRATKDWAFMEAESEQEVPPEERHNWSHRLGRLMDMEELVIAGDLYFDLQPNQLDFTDYNLELMALTEIAWDMERRYLGGSVAAGESSADLNPIRDFWNWNQTHKTGKLVFYSMADMSRAYWSTNDRNARAQWEKYEPDTCPKCRRWQPSVK